MVDVLLLIITSPMLYYSILRYLYYLQYIHRFKFSVYNVVLYLRFYLRRLLLSECCCVIFAPSLCGTFLSS